MLEVVEKLCDRIAIIDGGHLITICTMDELKQRNMDKSLEELFLKLTDDEFSDKFYNKQATVEDALKASGNAEEQIPKPTDEHKSDDLTAKNNSGSDSKSVDSTATNNSTDQHKSNGATAKISASDESKSDDAIAHNNKSSEEEE